MDEQKVLEALEVLEAFMSKHHKHAASFSGKERIASFELDVQCADAFRAHRSFCAFLEDLERYVDREGFIY